MKPYSFIGGDLDRLTIRTDGRPCLSHAVKLNSQTVVEVAYRLVKFNAFGRDFWVYVYSGTTTKEALEIIKERFAKCTTPTSLKLERSLRKQN